MVQPLTVEPFTKIQANSTWENSIHFGTEYAALLVERDFSPPDTTESLPQSGARFAVATMKGTGEYTAAAQDTGLQRDEWEASDPERQRWSERLRLGERLDGLGGASTSPARDVTTTGRARRSSPRALGYGTYVFTVRDTSSLDPSAAFGMLTWDDQGAEQNHRELDIEISQWGDRRIPTGQFVLQPFYVPANVARFSASGHAHAFVPLAARARHSGRRVATIRWRLTSWRNTNSPRASRRQEPNACG